LLTLGFGLVGAVAGCGDDEERPAGVASGATGGTGGTHAGRAGASGSKAVAASGDGGQPALSAGGAGSSGDGAGGAGGRAEAGGAGGSLGEQGGSSGSSNAGSGTEPMFDCPDPEPVELATLCDPERSYGDPAAVPIPMGGSDTLFSITPDELSIAWGSEAGFSGALWVADRSSPSEDFATPQGLEDPMLLGAQKLALSPDRLRVGVAVGGRFLVLVRANPGESFGEPEPGEFQAINTDAESNGFVLGDPVIAPDDRALYYSILGGTAGATLRYSVRTGAEEWPVGIPIEDCELEEHPRGKRQPTGISADGLTLFYYDAPRALSRAAYRAAIDAPFSLFVDLPGFGVQPNASCERLYYSAPTDLPLGIVSAELE
jgi:hypothetical protein